MVELDPSIHADLDRLRALTQPDADRKDRMWSALERQLGPSGPDDGGEDGSDGGDGLDGLGGSSGASQLGFVAKVIGATIGLTGAGLLSLRLAVIGVRALDPAPESTAQIDLPEAEDRVATKEVATASSAAAAARSTSTEPPAASDTSNPSGSSSSARAAVSGSGGDPEPSTDSQPSSLAAELSLIEQARATGSADETLTVLERHRHAFPRGQLADERELLRIEALCALGRLDAARETAAALRERGQVPAARVREICPALGG